MISPQVIAMTEIGQFETVRSWFDGFDDLQVDDRAERREVTDHRQRIHARLQYIRLEAD